MAELLQACSKYTYRAGAKDRCMSSVQDIKRASVGVRNPVLIPIGSRGKENHRQDRLADIAQCLLRPSGNEDKQVVQVASKVNDRIEFREVLLYILLGRRMNYVTHRFG